MKYLELDGNRVSKIGLGTWQFGSREWGYGEAYALEVAPKIVGRALDIGINLIDTAELYGFGKSETIVGDAIAERRDEVYLATKIFPILPVAPIVERRAKASARRLGTEHIDLYQVHQPNPIIRDRFTMHGMQSLQDEGVIGQVGVSNYSLARWLSAERHLGRPVISNQVQYSLVRRDPEEDLIPYAQQTGRMIMAYSPLGQGVLSGKYHGSAQPGGSVRRVNRLFRPDSLEAMKPLIEVLRQVATEHEATPAQIALAWTIHRPGVVAIPGASSVEQVESNGAAGEIDLSEDQYEALTAASDLFIERRS